jgi:ATP-dependent DNA helicase RecQ
MSTTKRPRTTKKKEPASRPSGGSARGTAAKPKGAARRTAAPIAAERVARATPRSANEAPPERASRANPRTGGNREAADPVSRTTSRTGIAGTAGSAEIERSAGVETGHRREPSDIETPTSGKKPSRLKSGYTLDGPIPPEAEGLPKNVGALLGIGQQTLGIKAYRPGQAEAFEHLLANEDLLAVMPTGSGKSLLYQLTSLVVPGVTVVVSPLIALIKDQIDKMVAKGVTACKVDSTLTVRQRREVEELVRSPGGKLLLTTPERMADPEFRVFLREACGGVGVSRFVVDEAHCVSQWGHDFRPAYLSLRKAIEDVGHPPVLATTATAPPHVRDDILFQLGIEGAHIVTTTFDRPNLHYEVIVFSDEDEKMKTLVTLLKKLPRPGIVYCATVKKVEDLYEALARWGIPVARYHGRMTKRERDDNQQKFMESSDLVMVATNAFGLGVDKANIRNVLHYHVPGSLEAYAQEAGRGGRDGKPARCVLLFSPDDVAIQEYFLSGTYPTRRQVRQVFEALEAFTDLHKSGGRLAEESPPNVANIALSSGVGQQRTRTVLSLLKDEHFIIEKEGGLYFVADPPPEPALLADRARQYEARRIADRQRLDALLAYVKAPGCRNQVILEYLGEREPPRCGRCDNCLRSREAALAASTEATRLGASVTRQLDDDPVEAKPKREIRARVVRIDQPPATPVPEPAAAPAPAPKPGPTVRRRSAAGTASSMTTAAAGTAPGAPSSTVSGAAPGSEPSAVVARPGSTTATNPENGYAPEPAIARQDIRPGGPAADEPQDDDELEDDDEFEDDELEGDELEGDEDEDDEDEDDDLDDDDDEDDDDDDLDDDEDDDDDDLDDDEDDYEEVIDKTAAELAEEGVEGPGEITVLARKRVPKQPKQRPERDFDTPSASAAEARRRRRRRRRKRRAMLPPKSAFTTPVLSTGTLLSEPSSRRMSSGGGPVIEYVRGPMRIAMAPVASANPNDAGAGRQRRGKKLRRWDRRFDSRGGGPGPRPEGPRPPPWQSQLGDNGGNGMLGERRRRRRRRRRRPGDGMPMQGQPGFPQGGNGVPHGGPGDDAPVSFFAPAGGSGPIVLGPDGQPLRKRRRRRRRGRGGRQREWRMQGQGGGGGGPPPTGSGGGPPPATGSGGGSISDGGDGTG